jgi:hypothetical protein
VIPPACNTMMFKLWNTGILAFLTFCSNRQWFPYFVFDLTLYLVSLSCFFSYLDLTLHHTHPILSNTYIKAVAPHPTALAADNSPSVTYRTFQRFTERDCGTRKGKYNESESKYNKCIISDIFIISELNDTLLNHSLLTGIQWIHYYS